MKNKIFILIFLILGMHSTAFSNIFLGFDGGINFATLKINGISDIEKKIGFHSGLLFNSPMIIDHFSIMTAVTFSTRGFGYEYTTTTTSSEPDTSGGQVVSTVTETADVKADLGYIDIPLMVCFFPFKGTGFFIQAGPQMSILVSDKATVTSSAEISTNGQQPQPTDPSIDNNIGFNKTDYSIIGGLGYTVSRFMIYARASKGLSDVLESGVSSKNSNNVTFQVGLAFSFL